MGVMGFADMLEQLEHSLARLLVGRRILEDQVNGRQAEQELLVGGMEFGPALEGPFHLFRIL